MTFLALLAMLLPTFLPIALFFFLRKKQQLAARITLIIGVALVVFISSLWILAISGVNAKHDFQQIAHVLNNDLAIPEDLQQQKYLLLGLANTAEAFSKYVNEYPTQKGNIDTLFQTMITFVTNEENYPVVSNKRTWKNNVFYLTQLNIMLNYYRLTTQRDTFQKINQKISNFLSAQLIRSPYKHLHSFENDKVYWTADNAQLLASLHQFDEINKTTNISKQAIGGWQLFCKKEMLYDNSQLPCAAFTAKEKCREAPHGTQLSATIAALSTYDMAFAKKIWKQYKFHYKHGTLNVFATFDQYHPQEIAPAYNKQNFHPLDGIQTQFATLKAAAVIGDKLTYLQMANQIWLQNILDSKEEEKLSAEYRWKGFYEKAVVFCAEVSF